MTLDDLEIKKQIGKGGEEVNCPRFRHRNPDFIPFMISATKRDIAGTWVGWFLNPLGMVN